MGILTASTDKLRGDSLRDDPLKGNSDPLGKDESKRVQTYYSDVGAAMHPEQHEAAMDYKSQVDNAVKGLKDSLSQYKSDFSSQMAEAEEKAQGILARARSSRPASVSQPKVAVNIASEGNHEATYYVNQDWWNQSAQQELQSNGADLRAGEDGSYTLDVHGYGKEAHEAFQAAERETVGVDQQYNDANAANSAAYGMSIQGLEEQIESQRKIATDTYNQNVDLAEQTIANTAEKWTGWVERAQDAFRAGVQGNNKGINALLSSGALILKGEVK